MDSAAKRQPEILTPEENHPALNALLGANPFVGLDATQVVGTLTTLLTHIASQPATIASRAFQLSLELGQIVAGVSSVAPEAGDKRFSDPAWTQHPLYHRMMQAYLAWRTAMHDLVNEDENIEWKSVEQQKFAVTLMTEALAPTNAFWLNPTALKRAFDTSGMSVMWGLRNFIGDLWNNGGMPSTVDKRPFEVGKNLAQSKGAVVFRSPVCEVIQYAPATDKV
jgi:polyhydroxyalkanoate synthase subunit PhaC